MATDIIPPTCTTSIEVGRAFRTALLLAGSTATAEAAVLVGIDGCGDLSFCDLLLQTVISAIRQRARSPYALDLPEELPPELRRLFKLDSLLRDVFVLRILAGFVPAVCAELLQISISDFERALYDALNQLPAVNQVESNRL